MGDTEKKAEEAGEKEGEVIPLIDRVKGAVSNLARTPTTKAQIIGGDLGGTNALPEDKQDKVFSNAGAIEPPYDAEMLTLLFEHSNSLRQNVDAYATNIDGFGHTFEPVVDLEADDVRDQVAGRMIASKPDNREPSKEAVDKKIKEIRRGMRAERAMLEGFFEWCCDELSFVELRKRTRMDREVVGNAYWEVLRNRKNDIARFEFVAAFTMRLLPLDPVPVEVEIKRPRPDFTFEKIKVRKRFRRFAQVVNDEVVVFKEFGDPRLISSTSGEVFADVKAMKVADPKAQPATEIMHFEVHSPRSAYGVPRWIGNLLAVLGSRQSEEVNFLYFENKGVPPLAVLVSGGRVSDGSVKKLEDFIETELKGKRNFHKILVIEGEPAVGTADREGSSRMRIELRPLTGAQQNDALFQKYDERNIDKVGMSFRLPRMLRGDIRDFNRSTALAAKQFTEEQVFQPEREEFDFTLNRRVLAPMGIRYWKFKSRAPITRDPEVMSNTMKNLANAGIMVPEEGRELMADVFNREFKKLEAEWTKQPLQLTLAGAALGEGGGPPDEAKKSLLGKARELIQLRALLREVESLAISREFNEAALDGMEREVVKVSEAKIRSFFEDDEDGDG